MSVLEGKQNRRLRVSDSLKMTKSRQMVGRCPDWYSSIRTADPLICTIAVNDFCDLLFCVRKICRLVWPLENIKRGERISVPDKSATLAQLKGHTLMEENLMRVFVLAAMLLASSSLYPSFAQEEGKAPVEAPQTGVPAPTDQKSQQQQDQRTGRDQTRGDDREMGRDCMIGREGMMRRGDGDRMGGDGMTGHDRMMGRDGMMRRGDGDCMGGDDREMGPNWRMHRDGGPGRDRDMDRERYSDRGDRDGDYTNRNNRGYSDGDRPRHRVKICVEYENGDEYCRYKE
jgi:hypothetical protein